MKGTLSKTLSPVKYIITAISVTAAKGIGGISATGLEKRDGVWMNPERVGAPVMVTVDVKGGVGAIRLIR